MEQQQYRDRGGVVLALTFLALGTIPALLDQMASDWWLVLAVPLLLVGGVGLAVELSRPKRPERES